MNPSWMSAAGLLFALTVATSGCGRKLAESVESEPAPDSRPRIKIEKPAPEVKGGAEKPVPPTGKLPSTAQPGPKAAPARPANSLEVQFTATEDFTNVDVGDGVALRVTCAGRERGHVFLIDARRHVGKRPGVTAPALEAAYVADAKAAERRYQTKGVVVHGVVVGKGFGRLYLSPTEEPKSIKSDGKHDLTKVEPDYAFTAVQFRQEFFPDEPKPARPGEPTPRQKFEGKVVEVTGVVRRFVSERGRASVMLFASGSQSGVYKEVHCYTRDDEPWAKVIPGQKATFRGVGAPALSSPLLVDSVIVDTEPAKSITATAPDLAAEYKTSRDATNAKYAGKSIYVTGEVASTEVDGGGGVRVFLKTGQGLPKALIEFGAGNEDHMASSLRPGTKVRACCKFFGNYDPAEVKLSEPLFFFE